MSMKNSNDTSWEFINFFIVLLCLHGFFRHNRARYPPTRLVCAHRTWNMKRDGTGTLKRWRRWMPLGLFSRVGAPSYSYHPVHFLELDTTSCGLPLYGPVPSGMVVTTVMWCLVLWGKSRHSYACSATDTSSIWIMNRTSDLPICSTAP